MVGAQTTKNSTQTMPVLEQAPQLFKWSTVSLAEVLATGSRLEASVFNIEGRQARETLQRCKWQQKSITGENGISTAYRPTICTRIFVGCENGIPMYTPSQISEINPRPTKYLSKLTKTRDFDLWYMKTGEIALTCSGTIGNVTYVSRTLSGKCFSQNLIRIIPLEYAGYLYAYLASKTGKAILTTNNYGAVIQHIDPEHLDNIPIPDASPIIKQQIHDLIMLSFRLRDESNVLMNEAQALLKSALKLPDIVDIKQNYFDKSVDLSNYSVKLSSLDGRMEASYHLPIVDSIQRLIAISAKEVLTVGDSRVSKAIILPGRFKRVYVEEGQGVTFFGGKQILELDPSTKKYLSLTHHAARIKGQLTLQENMTLITSSGTIGKVNIVPKHWDGWTANQHIIRVVPVDHSIAGYVYAWLASDYAYPLIHRFTYGAVVDEIDEHHVAAVSFPLLHDADIQKTINEKVLDANRKRFEAYELEQKALKIMDEKVIFAEAI